MVFELQQVLLRVVTWLIHFIDRSHRQAGLKPTVGLRTYPHTTSKRPSNVVGSLIAFSFRHHIRLPICRSSDGAPPSPTKDITLGSISKMASVLALASQIASQRAATRPQTQVSTAHAPAHVPPMPNLVLPNPRSIFPAGAYRRYQEQDGHHWFTFW